MKAFLATVTLVAALIFGFGTRLSAEGNCPPGYYQTSATDFVGCAPMSGGAQTSPDPGPRPQLASRWGAIAITNGAFGVANNLKSRRKAEKAALKQCKDNGGKDCRLAGSFGDQCAALAWGTSYYYVMTDNDMAKAENNAMHFCSKRTENCRIHYSACSYPVRLR